MFSGNSLFEVKEQLDYFCNFFFCFEIITGNAQEVLYITFRERNNLSNNFLDCLDENKSVDYHQVVITWAILTNQSNFFLIM